MGTLSVLAGIYAAGVIIAFIITSYFIARHKTNDNPLIGALLSWVTVIMVIVALFLKSTGNFLGKFDNR